LVRHSETINRSWLIRGYDSTTLIYEKLVPIGCYSARQVQSLLQALTAKAGLTNDETVGAYARRGTRLHNVHLEVTKGGPHCVFSCGSNPYFTAEPTSRT
jgi:hypothetical protein